MTIAIAEITPPTGLPVLLADAKRHLKVEHGLDDGLISLYIEAAAARVAQETGLTLLSARSLATMDARDVRGACDAHGNVVIAVPRAPLQGVISATLWLSDGTSRAIAPAALQVDLVRRPGRVVFAAALIAGLALRSVDALQLVFDAGFGAEPDDVPAPLRHAILKLIADGYERREVASAGSGVLHDDIAALIAPYGVVRL